MARTPEGQERARLFYAVIEKYPLIAISCRINLIDFTQALESADILCSRLNIANNFDRWKNPYFFLFRNLMDRFHEQREQFKDGIPLSEKIDFIFDDQTEKSYILAAWDEIVESQPEEIQRYYGATPRFESDQDCLPLQAADFWAWWVREWYEEDASPLPDKMKKRDFGKWHGTKPLPVISISFDESQILDSLQGIVFSSLPRGFRFGEVA